MSLDGLTRCFLIVDEVWKLDSLTTLGDAEGLMGLHIEQGLVDLDVTRQEGRSGLDQIFGQIISGRVVESESDITLPESKYLTDDVVLEEVHASEHVEHRRLLSPLTQREEFGWNGLMLGTSLSLFVGYVDHTLSGNSEIFLLKSLVIVDLDQIVWSELVSWHWLSLAVHELDWGVVTVLSEERDSLLASLNG